MIADIKPQPMRNCEEIPADKMVLGKETERLLVELVGNRSGG